jgi:hypothetical protein
LRVLVVSTRCDDRFQHRGRERRRLLARYLEGKTVAPERGDYYLAPGGEPAQAPGRWLVSADTLARLGIEGGVVDGPDFIALMEGRHPRHGRWLRGEGAGGGRGGGIDVTVQRALLGVGDVGARR